MTIERRRPTLAELRARTRVRRGKLIRQIEQLRKQGKTWRGIATETGLSAQDAGTFSVVTTRHRDGGSMTNGRRGSRRGGDQGQRYEVRFKASDATPEIVFGWSDSLEGAQAMVDRINRHPTWHSPRVIDRQLPHTGEPTTK